MHERFQSAETGNDGTVQITPRAAPRSVPVRRTTAHGRDVLAPDNAGASAGKPVPQMVIDYSNGHWRDGRAVPLEIAEYGDVPSPNADRRATVGSASADALAQMLISRFARGRSLQFLVDSMRADDLDVPRIALSNLLKDAAERMVPLAQRLHAHMLAQPLVAIGMTRLTDQIGNARRLWVYAGKSVGCASPHQIIWTQLTPDRTGGYARKALVGFEGVIQLSRLEGNERSGLPAGSSIAGCWRYVRQMTRALAMGREAPILHHILHTIEALNAIELQTARLAPGHGQDMRAFLSRPLISELYQAIDSAAADMADESPPHRWLNTILAHWSSLTLFLGNPLVPLENEAADDAVARLGYVEPWPFDRHPLACERLAAIFTLLENCRALGIDAESYLATVLHLLPEAENAEERLESLMPWRFQDCASAGATSL